MAKPQDFIRLSDDDERAYTFEKIQSGLQQIRISFIVFAILYGLFAILDNLLTVSWLPVFLFIRFVVVIPLFALFIASTFHASFFKVAQPLIVLCMVAGSTGIAFMLVVQPGNFSYYGGYFMVVIIFNALGVVTYRNQAYESLMQDVLPDVPVAMHPFEDIVIQAIHEGACKGERFVNGDQGQSKVLLVQADAVRNDDGRIAGVVTTCRDITERKEVEEKMRYLSFHDQLTGLYNRTWFDEELRRLDKARQLPLTIVMADLNGLKLINDTYGHAVGDSFLCYSAGILRQACRGADILARWGGDEFVLLLPQTPYETARMVADGIVLSFQEALFEGMPISVALGVATKDERETNLSAVLKVAEDRMYKQKLTESRSHKSAVLNALRNTLQEKSYETDTHAGNMQEALITSGDGLLLVVMNCHVWIWSSGCMTSERSTCRRSC